MIGPWWSDLQIAFWPVVVGVLCNVACGLLGCFLVLRRMSLLGDAISHAVLPGLVVAFLWSGQLGGWPMFLGAMAMGLLTAVLTQSLHSHGNVPEDASLGVVFTSLFALGVILISRYASQVDLDPGCVLYGMIEFVEFHPQQVLGFSVPRAFVSLSVALLAVVVFLALFWKELKLSAFDPALATTLGFSALVMHYLLMVMVAGVTVAAFEAVGSVLVVAMLVVPGATAHLLSDRLGGMLAWAGLCGVVAAFAGYWLAWYFNSSVAGMMAVVMGAEFLLAVMFAPRHGLLVRGWNHLELATRIVAEDVLAALYRAEEVAPGGQQPLGLDPRVAVPEASRLGRWLGVLRLQQAGEVRRAAEGRLALSAQGRQRARAIVRSHRLWEAFLEQNLQLPLDHLHDAAERMEHYIGDDLRQQLESELHQPVHDPHGRPIPPRSDEIGS